MKKKHLPILLAILFISIPVFGIFNGTTLNSTLINLRRELQDDYMRMSKTRARISENYEEQHLKMVEIMKECNEISLMLYSQKQDFTFDLCYALEKVTKEYNDFNKDRLPFDRIVNSLDIEIDRYARLIEALRRLPPELKDVDNVPDSLAFRNDTLDMHILLSGTHLELELEAARIADTTLPFILDEEGELIRDTCIYYATELLKMYAESKDIVVTDSSHYRETQLRLKETYDYARNYYQMLQNRIFVEGQTPWLVILSDVDHYWNIAVEDVKDKYNVDYLQQTAEDPTMKSQKQDMDRYDGKYDYMVQAFLVFLLIVELLVIWLIIFLLLLPVFKFVKPVKKRVAKGQKRYFALLVAIFITIIINSQLGQNNIFGKAVELADTFMWLLAAIIAALLIRLKPKEFKHGLKLYRPTIFMAVVVIGCRVLFIPNSLMNFIFPPILILFFAWQLLVCLRFSKHVDKSDRIMGWISLAATSTAMVISIAGYIFAALLILVWWYFQLAAVHTMTTIWHLTVNYKEKRMKRRLKEFRDRITYVSGKDKETLLFGATWFYDLIREVMLPVLSLMSVALCLHLALDVFDFDDVFHNVFYHPFVHFTDENGADSFQISIKSIVVLISLFFLFRYITKAARVLWQYFKYDTFLRKNNRKNILANEINLSLAYSIIGFIVWITYAVVFFVTLNIPTGSLSLVAGGFSAGVGLALKDIINNFIYGIQLMSGRLKVGDWIECDGIRGRVSSINYQTTQVETINNTSVSFPNASLFAKNFTNLTKGNSYEFLKILVGVAYGTDVQRVREVIEEAMQVMYTKDSIGRDVVDPKRGIYVRFGEFGDSAVNIAVKQYVLAAERIAYVDKAKEVIYNALKDNGITIPFPQCDVHLINDNTPE